jgi:23S rRNA pseudouridine1911/1915/1917 synthase
MVSRLILSKTQICFLDDYSSLEEALLELLPISKNKLKKNLPKKFLQKKVRQRDEIELTLDLVNYGLINPHYEGPAIDIIYEDDLMIVLNKPVKIHSHPLTYLESNNVLSFLREKFSGNILNVNHTEYDRGLLYRLDFETSGLICYIKQQALFHDLRNHFANVAKKKTYLGMVKGKFEKLGLFQHKFTAFGEKGAKQKVSDYDGDFLGELIILKSVYNEKLDQTLLTIELITGLRHQIRAQLAFLGFPLLGDELYGGAKADRLFLHALEYSFETKNLRYDFQAPIPKEFIF